MRPVEPVGETFLESLEARCREDGQAIFLDFEGDHYSYAEIDRLSTRMAHAFAAIGVGKGDTVVTFLDSHADAVIAWFAINKLGGVWVPVNTAYRGNFLRHQVSDSQAALLICEDQYLERLIAVHEGLPDLRRILVRGRMSAQTAAGPIAIEALDACRGEDETPIPVAVGPSDLACLIYTSGTTGPSKGCMISHNYLCNGGRQQNIAIPPLPGETTWTCLPLFHVGATSYVVVATLLAGARAAISPRFSVTSFWDEIERSGATTAMLMASMFPLLAQAPDNPAMLRCKGRLRAVCGVPLTEAVRAVWQERFGVAYMNSFGYGQTEASKICNLVWGDPLPPLTAAGPPSEDFEVRICDADGCEVPAGTPGEICVRPRRRDVMFQGYWHRPEDTVKIWKDLWMHTGDVGKFDENGYMYFVDRKKDYVRSRGENISSFEVEAALMAHPDISECAFHAVPAIAGGEDDLKITVILHEGAAINEETLFRWSAENLPYFAVPRFVEFRASLPKTPTGRVQKFQLRADGCTTTTWDARGAGLEIRRR